MNHCGARIKFFRKRKNLTIEQLAAIICKSKSTVSKYEKGRLTIDIDTLYEISNALNITIYQLLDCDALKQKSAEKNRNNGLEANKKYYLYYYDGRSRKIESGIIETLMDVETNICSAHMFIGFDDSFTHKESRYYFTGSVEKFHSLTYYNMTNVANPIEQVKIIVMESLSSTEFSFGIYTGISPNPLMPVAIKCLLTPDVVQKKEGLVPLLKFSKEDIKHLKLLNMFTPYPFFR